MNAGELQIRDALAGDLGDVMTLLTGAGLPTLGVGEHFRNYLVAVEGNRLVGAIGLELHGETGLLRSAVVTPERRHRGIGSLLYNRLLERAASLGLRRLYLLTNTAEEYFRRRGFRSVPRDMIRGPVTGSVEFTDACPSHAVSMELIL